MCGIISALYLKYIKYTSTKTTTMNIDGNNNNKNYFFHIIAMYKITITL